MYVSVGGETVQVCAEGTTVGQAILVIVFRVASCYCFEVYPTHS